MKLSDFLDKYHSRADKMRILKKMLKAAEANKSKTVSVKKARSIISSYYGGPNTGGKIFKVKKPQAPSSKRHEKDTIKKYNKK